MKLLLTSAGITNQNIAAALERLTGKSLAECRIGFIPTAANAQPGNKDWFFGQIDNLRRFGASWIDVVDIAAPSIDWRSRLEIVDVIFVGGGNTFYLLDCVRKSGFHEWLGEQVGNKVYVGVSAGSMIACPSIENALVEPADDNFLGMQDFQAMELVPYLIEPHCEGDRFEIINKWARDYKKAVYALADQSAVEINAGSTRKVSDGRAELYDYSDK